MIEMRDRIEIPDITCPASRHDDIPKDYLLHIREQFNPDGTVTTIHRKRVYSPSIIHAIEVIVDEEI